MAWFHWVLAGGTVACFGLVQAAMQAKGEMKGKLMFWHKSLGLLLLFGTAGRIGVRVNAMLRKQIPPHLPGNTIEVWAGKITHGVLYFLMVAMPVSVSGASVGKAQTHAST